MNSFYPLIVGGAEFQAKVIASEYLKQDAEIIYISIDHEKDEVQQIDGIKVYMLKGPHRIFDKLTWYYFYTKKFTKILDQENVDLVYERMLNSFSPYLAKYCKRRNIPFVIHIADKYCLDFDSSVSGRVKQILFNITKQNQPYILTQNQEQKELVERNGANVSMVVPNILDLHYSENKSFETPFKIYWIANERPVKQINKFIELAQKMQSSNDFHFYVIGKISEASDTKIKQVNNLTYLGSISNEEVNEHLKTAHVLVNTSISEGFSNTFIQAWMTGTPVVSLNSNPNMLFDKYKMGICCLGDDAQLELSILEILKNESTYFHFVEACKEICEEEFSFEKNKQLILDFLNRAMDE